jgi:hypothetical protein
MNMEFQSAFPFRRFISHLDTVEVLTYVDEKDAYKFMFALNKAARSFIIMNFTSVRRGFINEGLIQNELYLSGDSALNDVIKLEKLYFEAIKRTNENKIITLIVYPYPQKDF